MTVWYWGGVVSFTQVNLKIWAPGRLGVLINKVFSLYAKTNNLVTYITCRSLPVTTIVFRMVGVTCRSSLVRVEGTFCVTNKSSSCGIHKHLMFNQVFFCRCMVRLSRIEFIDLDDLNSSGIVIKLSILLSSLQSCCWMYVFVSMSHQMLTFALSPPKTYIQIDLLCNSNT